MTERRHGFNIAAIWIFRQSNPARFLQCHPALCGCAMQLYASYTGQGLSLALFPSYA